jgi:hypothetical protein
MWMAICLVGLAFGETPTLSVASPQSLTPSMNMASDSARRASETPREGITTTHEEVTARLDLTVPDLPPSPCVPNPAMRRAGLTQVDQGDEARIDGDLPRAAGHYRMGVTLDACNAYAWAGLGQVLLNAKSPRTAVAALETATRLMPSHFRAWTQLGQMREELGLVHDAIAAYQEALVVRDGYPPAVDGLYRASSR